MDLSADMGLRDHIRPERSEGEYEPESPYLSRGTMCQRACQMHIAGPLTLKF